VDGKIFTDGGKNELFITILDDLSRKFDSSLLNSSFLKKHPLKVSRRLTGIDRTFLVISWTNVGLSKLKVKDSEILPDYLTIFLSKMKVSRNDSPSEIHLKMIPSQHRKSPTQLFFDFEIEPGESISVTLPLEKEFLRYTDFPFDPNRGFDLPGALIEIRSDTCNLEMVGGKLLLTMPTPDFTMPYNVITLTSTVIVLFYGTIFNLLFRRFYFRKPSFLKKVLSSWKKSNKSE
jgi:phosphatidylinositol glycan class T